MHGPGTDHQSSIARLRYRVFRWVLYLGLTILFSRALKMASTAAPRLRVDVTSDTICPFCVLGVRQLQVAHERYSEQHPGTPPLELHFHPFQLGGWGKFTEKPVVRSEYMASNYGPERSQAFTERFDKQYKDLGLKGFAPDALLASSHLGHRLTAYAEQAKPEVAADVAIELMKNYQVDGNSPSDRSKLADIAVRYGLFDSEAAAKEWLDGDELDAEVKRQYEEAKQSGITGVPFFVFQEKYATSGAVGEEQFENIIAQVVAK